MSEISLFVWILPVVILVLLLFSSITVIREYERAVVFLLGRFQRVMGPGLFLLVPVLQQMVKVDLRTRVLDVPPQDIISKDNVSVQVSAVVYYRIVDPAHAIIQVQRYDEATSQLAQTTLRSILGQHDLDTMLAERDRLNAGIQEILDQQTGAWGIKVSNVEIKNVDLNQTMIHAIAKQAEAERLRRAKVINAEGEFQAAERLRRRGADHRDRARRHAAPLSGDAVRDRRRPVQHHRVPVSDRAPPDPGLRRGAVGDGHCHLKHRPSRNDSWRNMPILV